MPEIHQKIISCSFGHYYDANKYSTCPYCSSGGEFSATTDPFAGTPTDYGTGGGGNTEMPGAGGYSNGTIYPDAETIPSGGIGVTMPPQGNGNEGNFGTTTYVISDKKGEPGQAFLPVVGWLVAISGPNRGTDYRIHSGYNYIGRNRGDICIKGDDTISGERDSSITYVYQTKAFHIAHEQGKNVLLVNNAPVMGNGIQLHDYDVITVGTTNLIFLGLCGDHFSWGDKER